MNIFSDFKINQSLLTELEERCLSKSKVDLIYDLLTCIKKFLNSFIC